MPHNRSLKSRFARWHLVWMGWVVAGVAWAQTPEVAAPAPSPAASASEAPAAPASAVSPVPAAPAAEPAVPEPPAVPRYSASDIKTIFSYLDRNKDGQISREEASGFKGVARNFDRADTNKDGNLSSEEFSFAMNRAR